jgi:hypothetical protein
MEQLEPTNIYTYWPTNPAFHRKLVLFRRLFFINEDRAKYVFVGFYFTRDYLTLVEFGVFRRGGGPKTPCVGARHLLGFAGAGALHFCST